MRSSIVAAAVSLLACAAQTLPTWPTNYVIDATISLPYAGIVQPTSVHFDSEFGGERIEYYDGLDTYIYRSDKNVTWQINPVVDNDECFLTTGPVELQSILPSLTGFSYVGTTGLDGQQCSIWQLNVTSFSRVSTYTLYYGEETKAPVKYTMFGYNSLFGSHYDEYVVQYKSFQPNTAKASAFDKPRIPCGSFPGPGVSARAQLSSMRRGFPSTMTGDKSTHDPSFRQFATRFGKSYGSPAEQHFRAGVFHQNMHFIHAANTQARAEGRSLRLAPNHLTDMTKEELRVFQGAPGRPRPEHNGAHEAFSPRSDVSLPTSVDWRAKGAVTPIKDQGICGSCWSFGTTGTLEGQYFLQTGKLVQLSQQELVDCSWTFGNDACDGGEDFRAYQWIMQNGGLAATETYGHYLMQDGRCHAKDSRVKNVLDVVSYVNVTGGVDGLMQALSAIGPISISIDASLLSFSFYSSGVYYDKDCKSDPNDLDHTVLAVGYGETDQGEQYWIVKNSWSTHWGDEGYVKMSRKNNNCGVATDPTFAKIKVL